MNGNVGETMSCLPPMTGNGLNPTYKNGDSVGWFMIVLPTFNGGVQQMIGRFNCMFAGYLRFLMRVFHGWNSLKFYVDLQKSIVDMTSRYADWLLGVPVIHLGWDGWLFFWVEIIINHPSSILNGNSRILKWRYCTIYIRPYFVGIFPYIGLT